MQVKTRRIFRTAAAVLSDCTSHLHRLRRERADSAQCGTRGSLTGPIRGADCLPSALRGQKLDPQARCGPISSTRSGHAATGCVQESAPRLREETVSRPFGSSSDGFTDSGALLLAYGLGCFEAVPAKQIRNTRTHLHRKRFARLRWGCHRPPLSRQRTRGSTPTHRDGIPRPSLAWNQLRTRKGIR